MQEVLRCPPGASALQVRRCRSSTLKSGRQSIGGPSSLPLWGFRVETSASGLLHKLPILGKLFSFSGKSSLYRTGSARCSTTLRGIVPKTEANLLMHSDLWGLGRAVGQMSGQGWGTKKTFKRLRAESKNTPYSTLARET